MGGCFLGCRFSFGVEYICYGWFMSDDRGMSWRVEVELPPGLGWSLVIDLYLCGIAWPSSKHRG